MALIECSECGKKISDTVSKCIHCGATIRIEKKHDENTNGNVDTENNAYINYDLLTKEKQIMLESEFLASDEKAMKFRRKGLELPKLMSLGDSVFLVVILFIIVIRWILKGLSTNDFYDGELAAIGLTLAIVTGVLGLIVTAVAYIIRIFYNKSFKQYIYLKKFQVWLKENKNIEYIPTFLYDKEKVNFEKVDLTKMDL